MKKNAMYASRVVSTEDFIDMSHDAQALYFHLLADTQTDGELVNALMVVRAKGFSRDNLEELFEHDYLLNCDGRVYVRHHWMNNRYTAKAWQSMDGNQPYLDGLLVFEGDEGKSAYCLSDTKVTPSSHPSDTQASNECDRIDNQRSASGNRNGNEYTRNGNCNGSGNGNGTQQQQSEKVGVGVSGEGDSSHDRHQEIPCDWCGTSTYFTGEGRRCVVHCPTCGEHIWGAPKPEST